MGIKGGIWQRVDRLSWWWVGGGGGGDIFFFWSGISYDDDDWILRFARGQDELPREHTGPGGTFWTRDKSAGQPSISGDANKYKNQKFNRIGKGGYIFTLHPVHDGITMYKMVRVLENNSKSHAGKSREKTLSNIFLFKPVCFECTSPFFYERNYLLPDNYSVIYSRSQTISQLFN